ncbi:MAG: hypothetical protein M3Z30_13680 [Gemmatimonadota bacterium]|nr:hypothetical protein [Gemmatimonadota bacterium]
MSARDEHAYGTIVVVGGGCYGSYYVRQLERAAAASALTFDRIVVVDHDPHCMVTRAGTTAETVVEEWTAFFEKYLGASPVDTHDAIVPSPLMPHLMYEWLRDRARNRWPGRKVETHPLPMEPETPWRSAAPDGTFYASYATWTCPINCVEPRLCPHTGGERSWTMPDAANALVARSGGAEEALQGPVIFHCTHRAFGVGMFDTRDVVEADRLVQRAAERSAASVLVGTVSHCHGAFNVLHVGAEPS